MLQTGRGIVAVCFGNSRSRLPLLSKNKQQIFLRNVTISTNVKALQLEASEIEDIQTQDVPTVIKAGIKGGNPFKAYQAIQILTDNVDNDKINFKKDIEKDVNFSRLMAVIEKDTLMRNPTIVLTGLKNLYKLGIDQNSHVIQCVENSLMWNVRKVSMSVLITILLLQGNYQNTEMQRKALKETVETIQRRWVEINTGKEIAALYNHFNLFSADFIGRLDDRTIDLSEDMSYAELSNIFCALGANRRRATPVLRALAFHMAKQENKCLPRQLSNILFAMHSLSFPDQVLLDKIAKDLIPQISSIDRSSIIGGILFCMGQMRWLQTSLLEGLSEWIENNIEISRPSDLVSIILTLATVGYMPTNSENLFKAIIPHLSISSVNKETVWLDIVWSLCLLKKATNDHIASVLDPSFVQKITSVAQHLRMGIKLKLLNINSVAKLMMKDYDGPFLDKEDFKDIIITQSRNELMLTKHVQTMLHNFFPPRKYIHENIQTGMGVFVDSELAVDKNGKPIPIQDYSDNFGEIENPKPLPEGAVKIALFVWDYKDYTIGSKQLTGINQLAIDIMETMEHKVVQIPHFEYNLRAKTIKNVQYLESKIKEVVGVS